MVMVSIAWLSQGSQINQYTIKGRTLITTQLVRDSDGFEFWVSNTTQVDNTEDTQMIGDELALTIPNDGLVEFTPSQFPVGSYGLGAKGQIFRVENWFEQFDGNTSDINPEPKETASLQLWYADNPALDATQAQSIWRDVSDVLAGDDGRFPVHPVAMTATAENFKAYEGKGYRLKLQPIVDAPDIMEDIDADIDEVIIPVVDDVDEADDVMGDTVVVDYNQIEDTVATLVGTTPPVEVAAQELLHPSETTMVPVGLSTGPHKTRKGFNGVLHGLIYERASGVQFKELTTLMAGMPNGKKLAKMDDAARDQAMMAGIAALVDDGYDVRKTAIDGDFANPWVSIGECDPARAKSEVIEPKFSTLLADFAKARMYMDWGRDNGAVAMTISFGPDGAAADIMFENYDKDGE